MIESSTSTVSVVIPCYNGGAYLRAAIDSVLQQTVQPLEVLVIDDGSTDDSAAIAASYGPPVRVIRQENKGLCATRNRGIEESRGEWVAFLDADDVWELTKLQRQLEAAGPSVVAVHTNCYYFGRVNRRNAQPVVPDGSDPYSPVNIFLYHPFNMSSLLVRRALPERFPAEAVNIDYMVYGVQLVRRGRVVYVDEDLVGYRQHATNVTGNPLWTMVSHRAIDRWLRTNKLGITPEDAGLIRAGWLERVIESFEHAKWERNWPAYWAYRDYLGTCRDSPRVASLLATRPLPWWVYALKDRLAGLLGRGAPLAGSEVGR